MTTVSESNALGQVRSLTVFLRFLLNDKADLNLKWWKQMNNHLIWQFTFKSFTFHLQSLPHLLIISRTVLMASAICSHHCKAPNSCIFSIALKVVYQLDCHWKMKFWVLSCQTHLSMWLPLWAFHSSWLHSWRNCRGWVKFDLPSIAWIDQWTGRGFHSLVD